MATPIVGVLGRPQPTIGRFLTRAIRRQNPRLLSQRDLKPDLADRPDKRRAVLVNKTFL